MARPLIKWIFTLLFPYLMWSLWLHTWSLKLWRWIVHSLGTRGPNRKQSVVPIRQADTHEDHSHHRPPGQLWARHQGRLQSGFLPLDSGVQFTQLLKMHLLPWDKCPTFHGPKSGCISTYTRTPIRETRKSEVSVFVCTGDMRQPRKKRKWSYAMCQKLRKKEPWEFFRSSFWFFCCFIVWFGLVVGGSGEET